MAKKKPVKMGIEVDNNQFNSLVNLFSKLGGGCDIPVHDLESGKVTMVKPTRKKSK